MIKLSGICKQMILELFLEQTSFSWDTSSVIFNQLVSWSCFMDVRCSSQIHQNSLKLKQNVLEPIDFYCMDRKKNNETFLEIFYVTQKKEKYRGLE